MCNGKCGCKRKGVWVVTPVDDPEYPVAVVESRAGDVTESLRERKEVEEFVGKSVAPGRKVALRWYCVHAGVEWPVGAVMGEGGGRG